MTTEEEKILANLDEEVKYQHATCQAKHPRGSLDDAGIFTAICGTEAVVGQPDYPLCPKCKDLFEGFMLRDEVCPLCDKRKNEHA